ncbi:MAG TPA: Ig-like domain-containing protein [Solirubrobacteraceae bacterium]|nr:Ig-like domain-containing protein [Solirubrobacteraceae bacterium]
MRRGARTLALAALSIALMLTLVPAARAQTPAYTATITGFCCYETLEPGDTIEQWMEFRNAGTAAWYREGAIPVRLGTSNPYDRASPFHNPGDWLNAKRPTPLDEASVAPGATGRFTGLTKAPQAPGFYREFYAPLAEAAAWMAPTNILYHDYTIIPAQPPALQISSAPARVRRGDPIAVVATATDNRGVGRVRFSVGTQTVTATSPAAPAMPSTYAGTLSSKELGAGTHTLLVRANDLGGREASSTFSFEVFEPLLPPAPSQRLSSFRPLFSTRAGRGRRMGVLDGIVDVVGARRGARLRAVCVAGCQRRLSLARRVPPRGSTRLLLRPPLRLRRSTRIELQLAAPGFATRFQRYRFRRTSRGTIGKLVSTGCLQSQRPRRAMRCPR